MRNQGYTGNFPTHRNVSLRETGDAKIPATSKESLLVASLGSKQHDIVYFPHSLDNKNRNLEKEANMEQTGRPARLVIIRHAESLRNEAKKHAVYFADEYARGKIKGIPDHQIAITARGILQARLTGVALRERFGIPDYIYGSGYTRVNQTRNKILSAYTNEERARIKVRDNPFIRERDPGYTYDMTEAEVNAAFPWLQDYWDTFGGWFGRPPGGESLEDVAQRAYLFLNMLFRDRAGQNIFVITHGGTIRCFRFLLERWTFEQALKWPPGQSPKNCGITAYEYDSAQGRLVLQEYNTVYWKEKGGS